MASAVERHLKLVTAPDRYDIPYRDLVQSQCEAATERLASQRKTIPLLANRAETANSSVIREPADLVPLLFAHTAYKSYSENWLTDGKWDRMAKWLATVSTSSVEGVDFSGVRDIDDWLKALQPAGAYVSCTSGTTGKPGMLNSSTSDIEISCTNNVQAISWATGMKADGECKMFGIGPRSTIERNERLRSTMIDAFAAKHETYQLPIEPVTVGKTSQMIRLRRAIGEGSAPASDVAAFEALSRERQSALEEAMQDAAEALIANREQKIFFATMWASVHPIAVQVRAAGYDGKDFNPENRFFVAGGLKGAILPPDYKEFVMETFNIDPRHAYNFYSMQEINTPFPMCSAGRYHVAPWVIMLPLDEPGENLLDTSKGEIEARAAFFDISLEGRWGGIISGDKITADFGKCACGHQGPTVGPEITRFSDTVSGDKITCAGTIDAYVRGEA